MTMYTVVVCSNCKHVWIVKDRPERSQCRKCRKTRLYSKLKKYYRDDDLEAAQLARAHAQAKVNDQEERFQDALDRGVLEEELESIFDENEYAEKEGIDREKLESVEEEILDSPSTSISQREIVQDGIKEQDKPSLDEFLAYVEDRGVDSERAVLLLEKLVKYGDIALPSTIDLAEVEAKTQVIIEASSNSDSKNENRTPIDYQREEKEEDVEGMEESSSTARRDLLIEAASKYDSDPESVISSVVEDGMARDKAVLGLEKLVRSGDIPWLEYSEVEQLVAEDVGFDVEENSNPQQVEREKEQIRSDRRKNKQEKDTSVSQQEEKDNRSNREIMEDAVEKPDEPTIERAIEYATEHGIQEKKAERHLKKMIRSGEVMERPDGTLRLI